MMKTYYRKAKGSLLVYDVTNRSSFMGLEVRGGGERTSGAGCCLCFVAVTVVHGVCFLEVNFVRLHAVVAVDTASSFFGAVDLM